MTVIISVNWPLTFDVRLKAACLVRGNNVGVVFTKVGVVKISRALRARLFTIIILWPPLLDVLDPPLPLDYCKDDNDSVNVTLEDPSVQCDFNRIGLLCGRCGQYFNLALGCLHCIPCNNNYHSALILFFALAGVILIAIIFILQLTVSIGTLNGLLFYANIIQANHQE